MRNRSMILAASALSACLFSTVVLSDTLKIGVSEQAQENQKIHRPKVGMSMDTVKSMYGNPTATSGPTGTPSIYQWKYADFTVYFEGEYVIHSVLHPSKAEKTRNEQP